MIKRQIVTVLMFVTLTTPVWAIASDGWEFEVTPYLWMVGKDGVTGQKNVAGVRDVIADVDMSFSDIFERLDSGFLVDFHAKKGPWTAWLDIIYMKISDDAQGELLGADVEIVENAIEIAAAYKPAELKYVDFYAGGRYQKADTEIQLSHMGAAVPSANVDVGDTWIDPIVGVRFSYPLSFKWGLLARADVGGFGVGSDLSWHTMLLLKYQINDLASFKIAYRYIDTDYDDDDYVYDLSTSGISVGVGFTF